MSKRNSGGLSTFRRPAKELPDCQQRCPVRRYELYNARCPDNRPHGAFYLKPLTKYTASTWYAAVPVGVNTLGNIVKDLCKAAGFEDTLRIIRCVHGCCASVRSRSRRAADKINKMLSYRRETALQGAL